MSGWGREWRDYDPNKRTAGAVKPAKRSKFGNVPSFVLANLRIVEADGLPPPAGAQRFDSRKEAERFVELSLQQRDGKISDLQCQVPFQLHSPSAGNDVFVATYVADFVYRRPARGPLVVEDVKSPASKTPLYELKKKMLRAEYGIAIDEL